MKLYPGTGTYEIYYAAPRNTIGLTDVKVSMWKHNGTQVLNDVSMTEVGDGIYKHPYNFDSTTWYIAQSHSESLNVERTQSIRIGFPANDYVYVVSNDSTNIYEVNKLDGSNVMAGGPMPEIGSTGIFYTDITSLADGKYFFKLNHKDHARFDYPLRAKGVAKLLSLVLEKGFNIAAWNGTGMYTFNESTGNWQYIDSSVENASAYDLWKYIKFHYPSVIVKYLKSYTEYPTERFRIYLPDYTPPTDINNFTLVEYNQNSDPEQNAFYAYLDMTSAHITIEAK